MPVNQQPHGIGSYIKKINQEYRNEYNTQENIFNLGDNNVSVAIPNETVKGVKTTVKKLSEGEWDSADTNTWSIREYDNGSKIYTCSTFDSLVQRWDLSTPYDMSTQTLHTSDYAHSSGLDDLAFKPDGTVMATLASDDSIQFHDLSAAWDLASVTTRSTSVGLANATALWFRDNGRDFYVNISSDSRIDHYRTQNAWQFESGAIKGGISQIGSFSFPDLTQGSETNGITLSSDGTKLYIVDTWNQTVHSYNLSTAWDISTATYDMVYHPNLGNYTHGVDVMDSDTKLLVWDRGGAGGTAATFGKDLVI